MKRILLLLALLLLVAAGVAAALYYRHETRRHVVYGSSTTEFVPTAGPTTTIVKPPKGYDFHEPWPLYGFDQARTRVGPYALRPPYRRIWTMRSGYYIEMPPAVAYGRVFVAQLRGRFYAVDARTGKVRWQKRFVNKCTAASPVVDHGLVYEPYLPRPCNYGDRSKPGFIVAMRAGGGKIVWRLRGPASESSPVIVNRTMYFGAWDHRLYAVDLRRRKIMWTFKADGELNASPAYAGATIYIGSQGGTMYAVNATNGKLRWSAHSFSRFGRREAFYATPTVAYGRVYAGNVDGTVYSFGAGTGHLIWAQPAGSYVYSAPAVWNRTVYAGSYDGNVYAFDAATGRLRWKYASPGSIHGAPTVLDGLIYYSTCGTCGEHGSRYAKRGPRTTFALNARTGRLVWTFPDGHYSPIVADRERIYLTGDTRVYALVPRR